MGTRRAWRMVKHREGSDLYQGVRRPGHTLWPQGIPIAGLTNAEAALVGAAPEMQAALLACVRVLDALVKDLATLPRKYRPRPASRAVLERTSAAGWAVLQESVRLRREGAAADAG